MTNIARHLALFIAVPAERRQWFVRWTLLSSLIRWARLGEIFFRLRLRRHCHFCLLQRIAVGLACRAVLGEFFSGSTGGLGYAVKVGRRAAWSCNCGGASSPSPRSARWQPCWSARSSGACAGSHSAHRPSHRNDRRAQCHAQPTNATLASVAIGGVVLSLLLVITACGSDGALDSTSGRQNTTGRGHDRRNQRQALRRTRRGRSPTSPASTSPHRRRSSMSSRPRRRLLRTMCLDVDLKPRPSTIRSSPAAKRGSRRRVPIPRSTSRRTEHRSSRSPTRQTPSSARGRRSDITSCPAEGRDRGQGDIPLDRGDAQLSRPAAGLSLHGGPP